MLCVIAVTGRNNSVYHGTETILIFKIEICYILPYRINTWKVVHLTNAEITSHEEENFTCTGMHLQLSSLWFRRIITEKSWDHNCPCTCFDINRYLVYLPLHCSTVNLANNYWRHWNVFYVIFTSFSKILYSNQENKYLHFIEKSMIRY